jgi:hypothetical protein
MGNADETPAFRIFADAVGSLASIPDDSKEDSSIVKPKRLTGSTEIMTTLLQEAGFENIQVKDPVERYLQVSSAEEYYNRFALTSPNVIKLLGRLNETQTEELKSKVISLATERSSRTRTSSGNNDDDDDDDERRICIDVSKCNQTTRSTE